MIDCKEMRMPQIMILVMSVLIVTPSAVFAWGQTGHRIVAEVAQRHVTPAAAAKIKKLLAGQSLAAGSTWPDEIRSDAKWDCAKPFHFVTVPPGKHYPEGAGDEGDVVKAIVFYASVLRNTEGSVEVQAQALKFLVHFLGDIHQPLHVGLQSHLDQIYTCYTNSQGDHCPCFCGQCATGTATFGGCPLLDCIEESSNEASLAYQYASQNTPVIEEQLLKGGVRLAGMLNWIFAEDMEPPQAYTAVQTQIRNMANWEAPMKACTGE